MNLQVRLKVMAPLLLVFLLPSVGYPQRPTTVPREALRPSRHPHSNSRSNASPLGYSVPPVTPLAAPTDPATPGVAQGFLGWNGRTEAPSGFLFQPPDTHCSVGSGTGASGRLLVTTNNGLKLMGKDGSTVVAATSWGSFFGVTPPAGETFGFDPKSVFDPASQRFFVIVIDGESTTDSTVYIAASRTATPSNLTTDWNRFSASTLSVISGFTCWFDYPSIGVDSSRVVVTGNMFDGTETYRGVKIRVFNKADLISTSSPAETFADIDLTANDGAGWSHFTLQPASVQSGMGVTDSGNFYLFQCVINSTNAFRLVEVQGTPPSAVSIVPGTDVVRVYGGGVTHAAYLAGGAPQLGGAPNLDTLTNRTLAADYCNGVITAVNDGDTNGDGQYDIFWVKMNTNGGLAASLPTLNQAGVIRGTNPSTDSVYMPAVNENTMGDTTIVYCESSASKFEEIRYTSRHLADAAGAMQTPVLVLASAVHYDDYVTTVPERWGDFAAVCVDPTDASFWMAQEFARATGSGGWGVQIFQTTPLLDTTPPSVQVTGVMPGPPKVVQITCQDTRSGIVSIVVNQSTNCIVSLPSFPAGDQQPLVVSAAKIDPLQGSVIGLTVTDLAGNVTVFDPAALTLTRTTGKPVTQTVNGLKQAESKIKIMNGKPGLTGVAIVVNGREFAIEDLRDGQVSILNVASAMRPGSKNTITLTATGKPGGSADVLISN